LSKVHDVLCRDLKGPKQKHRWSLYLKVTLPGVALSRAQVFKDITAWRKAEESFPTPLLDEFLSDGYAFNVRPSVEEPLGKFTEPCQHLLAKLGLEELDERQCRYILGEAATTIKQTAKKSCPRNTPRSADEKRERILAQIHESFLRGMEELTKAVESGESYSAMRVRDDLEFIFGRLMTATQVDALELEPRVLPDGFKRLSVEASPAKSQRKRPATQPHSPGNTFDSADVNVDV
jgi:hypothetical protein